MNHKIKITPRNESNKHFFIELDGTDISNIVQGVTISLKAGDMPFVSLFLVPMEIDIPAELEAMITIIRNEL